MINALSAQVLAEAGADMSGETPNRSIPSCCVPSTWSSPSAAKPTSTSPTGPLRNWNTGELSERGIDGVERMRLIRDEIDTRVRALVDELVPIG